MELPKEYKAHECEKKWIQKWDRDKTYRFDPGKTENIFSIDTPPPTVSGRMHMGHAFGNSQQDFIARYKRMRGYNVLQPFGTDDNGLPTQLYIEKLKKVRASRMERGEFVRLCLKTLEEELTPGFTQDWKNLGISCDFDVSYTTINRHCRRISQKSFLDLHRMGRAYRQEAPAMWCPKCETAISQVELEDLALETDFCDIVFDCEGSGAVISTTRPELLPACVGLFFHPDDERYKGLLGKQARVPLFGFAVPVMADARVSPQKGTGLAMCCTFGDQTDMEWQKQYSLPIKAAIERSGRMTKIAGPYAGLGLREARKKIIDDLRSAGLLLKQQRIVHSVNTHERCGTEIEFLHSKQWFIRYLDLRENMLKWGEELRWYPAHMKNRYDNWVRGLSWDWCISRQIFFGIPFPVWYCKSCGEEILAREKDLPVDPLADAPPVKKCRCGSKEFEPDRDIINTWATSSLSPSIVKELFRSTPVYKHLVSKPMDMRPQGHDIISFWLFNTVVKSKLHHDMLPWNAAFINGWILDPKGKKMSKSKENIIEPSVMIKKYCADILRYMCAASKLGEDLSFPEKEMVAGKRFVNKLWNASRFVAQAIRGDRQKPGSLELLDRWILARFSETVEECTASFEEYEFSKAKAAAEKFFWQEFCDLYLEIVKDRLYNPEARGREKAESARHALAEVLLGLLKLFAPFMPFVTEEIHSLLFERGKSIHLSSWPKPLREADATAISAGELAGFIIQEVRRAKTQAGMSLKEPVKCIRVSHALHMSDFLAIKDDLKAVTAAADIEYSTTETGASECAVLFP